jgi:hypothetical protein
MKDARVPFNKLVPYCARQARMPANLPACLPRYAPRVRTPGLFVSASHFGDLVQNYRGKLLGYEDQTKHFETFSFSCVFVQDRSVLSSQSGGSTRAYPKVSGLTAWSENCKWYSSLLPGVVVSLFCESV